MKNNRNYSKSIKDMSVVLLAEGKSIRMKASGYSMYPSIKPGALLLIEPLSIKGRPVPGEIVAIKRENGLVVHRITKRVTKNGLTWYIARGDSNPRADHPVTIDSIAGRIIKAEPTGENPVPADIRINKNPLYFVNRIRVIFIFLKKKIVTALS
jgi:signal peptidase I